MAPGISSLCIISRGFQNVTPVLICKLGSNLDTPHSTHYVIIFGCRVGFLIDV